MNLLALNPKHVNRLTALDKVVYDRYIYTPAKTRRVFLFWKKTVPAYYTCYIADVDINDYLKKRYQADRCIIERDGLNYTVYTKPSVRITYQSGKYSDTHCLFFDTISDAVAAGRRYAAQFGLELIEPEAYEPIDLSSVKEI